MWYWDSNTWPFKHESSSIAKLPGLPSSNGKNTNAFLVVRIAPPQFWLRRISDVTQMYVGHDFFHWQMSRSMSQQQQLNDAFI